MAIKIKYEQKYLDEDLKNHINELLENLTNVQSDDEDNEDDDKENLDDDDDDDGNFETDSDEEDEEADNCIKSKDLNKLNGNSKTKNKIYKNNVDESMETT